MTRRSSPLDHVFVTGTTGSAMQSVGEPGTPRRPRRKKGQPWPPWPRAGRVVATAAAALACILVAGCADPTGDIDDQGHNGYDMMTCEQAKAFALDIQYNMVLAASVQERIADLSADAAKASHPEVRQAATALISGYQARNRRSVTAATASLVKACQM
jgi:hypothetical protein